jgi:siroheme synthase-like protein
MPQPKKKIPDDRRYLTLGVDMSGLRCLVVGGGPVGNRKVTTFLHAGADVAVLAPSISADLQKLAATGQVHWMQGAYRASMLEGFQFVVAATSNRALNLRIAADAEKRGILSCNVSSAGRTRIIFPAMHEEEGIAVAVHSHGRSCRHSQLLRNEIAGWLQDRKSRQ